ncbi:MAG TPA: alpha/beta fold hydrolase [Candidatus Binataceae bacterium]
MRIEALRRPTLFDALGEFRVPLEATMFWLQALTYPWPRVSPSDSKVVMLIPGFMAGDVTLLPMANFCRWLGHTAVFGGIWSNSKCPRLTLDQLGTRLAEVSRKYHAPVVVIGQSLGGVYARQLARRFPDRVDQVISLGSPINNPRAAANLAVQAVARTIASIRGRAEGCLSESCACGLSLGDGKPDHVPATVVFSRSDGIVHWQSCIDRSGSPLVENVEVMCSHVGMGLNVDVYRIIAERLARPAGSDRRLTRDRTEAAARAN